MSSIYVRDQIKNFLVAGAPSEKFIGLDGEFQVLKDLLDDAGVAPDGPWVGLEFMGGDENPVSVPATNDSGKYREEGAVYVHVVDIAKLGVSSSILTRAETLRNLLRGSRIGSVLIESVTPANFGNGATLNFEGGYTSASFLASYQYDKDL